MAEYKNFGKYQIIKELGYGGFGVVYQAHDLVLDRPVALKILHSDLTSDPTFLNRFHQEARFAAKIDHPNIVPVYDYSQVDGQYFNAMGLMTGGSLIDHLKKKGPLDPNSALIVFKQILEGVRFIHEKEIIHRDLKPANILFDSRGMARISDLGIARSVNPDTKNSFTKTGFFVGSPPYVAPEIWNGNKATVQSDIYSLGCIAYEMLSGKILFNGTTPAAIMTKHIIEGPRFEIKLTKTWKTILEKCLANATKDRYPSVEAILSVLDNAQLSLPEKPERKIATEEIYPEYKQSFKKNQINDGIDKKYKPKVNVINLGHVDHGKTTLTAAITKILAMQGFATFLDYNQIDNAPEKECGNTSINVSHVNYETSKRHYAHLDMLNSQDIIKNFIIGDNQVNGAILVVSGLDGPMYQTYEQVRLARLVGIHSIVVFLNKTDLFDDPELLELVEMDLRELLSENGFSGEDTPIIWGSALAALRSNSRNLNAPEYQPILKLLQAIDEFIPEPIHELDKPFLMPIEDIFNIKGRGVVVTGRIQHGQLRLNDPVEIVGLMDYPLVTVATAIEMH